MGAVVAAAIAAYAAKEGQESANNTNMYLSQRQMDFQQYNANTAHRREVTDLNAAGLNPILSANSGASAPSGASATVQNEMSAAGDLGIATAQAAKDMKVKDTTADVNEQAAKTSKSQAQLNEQSAKTAEANQKMVNKQAEILEMQKPAIKSKVEYDKTQNKLLKDNAGKIMLNQQMNTLANTARTVKDTLNPFHGLFNGDTKKGQVLRQGKAVKQGETIYDSKTGEILNESY